MRKLNAILLCLGVGFLSYLLWKVGPAKLWHQASALGWGVLPLILIEGMANLMHTLGWRQLIMGGKRELSWHRLFRMAMAGYAINYLTPTASVGGDVSRAALLASNPGQNGAEAASSVLLDKLTTGIAHLLLAVIGVVLLVWRVRLASSLWLAMAAATLLLTAGLVVFLWLQKQGKLGGVLRWLVSHNLGGRALAGTAQRISEVDETLKRFYRERPKTFVLSVAWHWFGHSAAILQAWVFLYLLNQPAPLVTVATAGLLSLWFDLLTFAVPLNLGTLEGSRIVVFQTLGCGTLLGMTFGVAIRVAQVFWACFGLVSYGHFSVRPGRQLAQTQAGPALGERAAVTVKAG